MVKTTYTPVFTGPSTFLIKNSSRKALRKSFLLEENGLQTKRVWQYVWHVLCPAKNRRGCNRSQKNCTRPTQPPRLYIRGNPIISAIGGDHSPLCQTHETTTVSLRRRPAAISIRSKNMFVEEFRVLLCMHMTFHKTFLVPTCLHYHEL